MAGITDSLKTDSGLEALQGFSGSLAKYRDNIDKINKATAKQALITQQLSFIAKSHFVRFMQYSAKAAIKFEDSMLNIKDSLGSVTNEEMKQFSKSIKDMGEKIALDTNDIANIAAIGAEFGVANKDLMRFTELSAKMSVGFGVSADESARKLNDMMKIYGVGVDEAQRFLDVSTFVAKSAGKSPKQLLSTFDKIGASAKNFGLTYQQTAALSTTFLQMGKTSGEAAAAIDSVFDVMLGKGDGANEVLNKLNLDAKTMKEAIATDAGGALSLFLGKLGELNSSGGMEELASVFGEERVKDIQALGDSYGDYLQNLKNSNNETKTAGAFEAKFNEAMESTSAHLVLLQNSITRISLSLGGVLLPAIKSIVKVIAKCANILAILIEENELFVKIVVGVIASMYALRTAYLLGALACTLVGKTWLRFKNILIALNIIKGLSIKLIYQKIAATRIGIITAKAYAFAARLCSNGWSIASRAIGAGGRMIGKSGSIIRSVLAVGIWSGIGRAMGVVSGAIGGIGMAIRVAFSANPLGAILTFISLVISGFNILYDKVKWFKDAVDAVWGSIKNFFGFGDKSKDDKTKKTNNNATVTSQHPIGSLASTSLDDKATIPNNRSFTIPSSNVISPPPQLKPYVAPTAYTPPAVPSANGSSINVNFSGNFLIGANQNGYFDLESFKKQVTQAVMDAMFKTANNKLCTVY